MKKFLTVLELETKSQSAAYAGMKFRSRSEVCFFAADESRAKQLIQENFGARIPDDCSYELQCEGNAPPGSVEGFAIRPLG